MVIRKLVIENYKGFRGQHVLNFDGNLLFFVGENNTGKSSIFEAINFVKSGLGQKKLDEVLTSGATGHLRVTIRLQEHIRDVISNFSQKKYEKFVFDDDGVETLLVQRSSEEREITQSGKTVKLSVKKVTLWNPETEQFENPSGVDSVLKTLFETQFVWADTSLHKNG